MRTLRFEGYSDDTFGWTGDDGTGDDHDGCASGSVRVYLIQKDGHRMLVTGAYGKGSGCWAVGIAPAEEGDSLPPWPMRWSFEGYSTILEIDAPDGALPRLIVPEAT